MLGAIDDIKAFITGVERAAFDKDKKTISAVERELLRIGEACGKLCQMEDAELSEELRLVERFPQIPWRQIRDIGNLLRHEYGRVDHDIIWETVSGGKLTDLRDALSAAYPHVQINDRRA